jgi:hypothetical protein
MSESSDAQGHVVTKLAGTALELRARARRNSKSTPRSARNSSPSFNYQIPDEHVQLARQRQDHRRDVEGGRTILSAMRLCLQEDA